MFLMTAPIVLASCVGGGATPCPPGTAKTQLTLYVKGTSCPAWATSKARLNVLDEVTGQRVGSDLPQPRPNAGTACQLLYRVIVPPPATARCG